MRNKKFELCKLWFVILSIALFLFLITFSISLPIFIRPFYYAHIDALELTQTGFSKAEIKEAYNGILDFLTLPGKEFSTGTLKYSSDGMDHFYDCKTLFSLNTSVLFFSSATIIFLMLLKRFGKIKINTYKGFSPFFYSAVAALVIPLFLVIFISLNFEKAFRVFHKIFFKGKSNWVFNPNTDEIINILPEQFFMNCAILIAASIFVLSFVFLLTEILRNKNRFQFTVLSQ